MSKNPFRLLLSLLTICFVAPVLYAQTNVDWLLDPSSYVSAIRFDDVKKEITLANGLIERRIALTPEATTLSMRNLTTGEEYVRALSPEARVTINGEQFPVGGMEGAPVANYWKEEWAKDARPLPNAYRFERYETGDIEARFPYKKRSEWLSRDVEWPPKGKRLSLFFQPPRQEDGTARPLPCVEVRYEIYDGAPLISKRLFVRCPSNPEEGFPKEFVVDSFVSEEIRLVEASSDVDSASRQDYNLMLMSDYVFGGMKAFSLDQNEAFRLKTDPNYPTQVNYARQTPCLLECSPELGPAQTIRAGEDFESYGVYEILFENTERERRGLALRRAMRILAPWTQENPLMFHKVQASPEAVRDGIAQCEATGFEVLIMSFGSGFNLESKDKKYREVYKELSLEAASKGIALGGYSLTSSRGAGVASDNVQNPNPRFGKGPCLQSAWGLDYFQTLKDFMETAQFGVFENDGPYPGDFCESDAHPGHRGKEDSVWNQHKAQANLYKWCRARGIYVNQPDGYFLNGGNKTGMGYRETNWSLPRAEQVIIERQNVYDGTWSKSSSLGWMFVPLSQYHGGGAAATIEPLKDHLDHYDARFANLIGAGTQACWRGPRLFDAPETKEVVVKWVNFYKANRRILDSDIIHVRRATGRDWDGWLHVDPDKNAKTRGLAFFYNPLQEEITRQITVPLYYAGLKDKATVRIGNSDLQLGEPFEVKLNDKREAVVEITIPAEKYAWVTFEP